jgi:hypothetical protein
MSDTVSFAELDRQHVELLPARTVLSMFNAQDGGGLNGILDGIFPKEGPLGSLLGMAPTDGNTGGNSADGAAGASQ